MSTITIVTEDTQKEYIFKNEDALEKAIDERKIYIGFREEYSTEKFYFENKDSVVYSDYFKCYIDKDYSMFHQVEGYIFES